jgi:predicted RNA-binding Zn-ribbon protein involved in translation (DUF1610 family)
MVCVPWCETCDRFLSPSTVHSDGTCPSCGRTVDAGRAHAPGEHAAHAEADEEDLPPVPWHLKLLAAAVAVYLGYRAFQGIEWLVGRF